MRGFRDFETLNQFVQGFLVYYNYLRTNEALDGKTPAEAAMVDYDVKSWANVCRIPVSRQAVAISYRKPRISGVRVRLPRTQIGRPRKRHRQSRKVISQPSLTTVRL
jgi:hypothetical protein